MYEATSFAVPDQPEILIEDLIKRRQSLLPRAVSAVTTSPGGTLTTSVRPDLDPMQYGTQLEQLRRPGPGIPAAAEQASVLPSSIEAYRKRAADLYKQGSDLYNADVDTSALQAFAKQQGERGNASMLNAMAAQFAGESFQPIQAQYLKRAAAAQEPIKIGGGMLTPDGQFIKDPFAGQEKKAEFLLQQAKAYEQMAATAETAQERAEALRMQNEMQNQLRLMGLNIQTQGLEIQRQGLDLRRELANNKPVDNSKTWRAEDNLRSDFDKLTKDLREELGATSKITQIVSATPPGQKPDAITQQSLVILLNKFLDPGSVVREGEFDRVVKAQGLEGQARNLYDRIVKGQPLDANTIRQINGLASLYAQAATGKLQSIANDYTGIARKRGLDVEAVISDPRFRSGAAPAGGAPRNPAASVPLTPQEQAELEALRKKHRPGGQ